MTDYLELLLERRQEEEEENREAPVLEPEGETFSGKRPSKGAVKSPEPSPGGGARPGQGTAGRRGHAWSGPPIPEASRPAASGETVWPRRPETAGELLEQRLEQVPDALTGRAQGQTPAAPEPSGLPPVSDASYLDRLAQGTGSAIGGAEGPARRTDFPGGAEGLARRLAQASLATAAAPARVVFDGDSGTAPAAVDWEAFDRQLERDARRYDGGLVLY